MRNVMPICFLAALLQSCGDATPEELAERDQRECVNQSTAFNMAKRFVEGRLKSPSTAEFGPYREASISSSDQCAHQVLGYVDAQNAFGGTIRSGYSVNLKYNKNGKGTGQWSLVDLQIE